MNEEETKKFDRVIEEGYERLVLNRPSKPLEAFIYYLWSQLSSEELKNKDERLKSFCASYKEGKFDTKETDKKGSTISLK